jgi:DnaJ-domain-containing protein 1
MVQQMAMAKAQADLRKVEADAAESEADAKKTTVEAANAQLDLMIRSGQLQAAVQQIVAQSLQAYLAPPPVPLGLAQAQGGFAPQ